jgi:hypothetical protein
MDKPKEHTRYRNQCTNGSNHFFFFMRLDEREQVCIDVIPMRWALSPCEKVVRNLTFTTL